MHEVELSTLDLVSLINDIRYSACKVNKRCNVSINVDVSTHTYNKRTCRPIITFIAVYGISYHENIESVISVNKVVSIEVV